MKIMKKIQIVLLSICLAAGLFPAVAHAASASVKVSSASGNVGQTVTVNCTAALSGADIGGADVTLQYDPSAISVTGCSSGANGGSGSVYYSAAANNAGTSTLSFSVTFEILKEGSHAVTVTYADVYDWELAESVATSKSGGTIKGEAVTTPEEPEEPEVEEPEEPEVEEPEEPEVEEPEEPEEEPEEEEPEEPQRPEEPEEDEPEEPEKDKNSKLSSLQVYPGTLKPGFDANTTSYIIEATADTTDVTITASAVSDKAKVTVSGGKDLKLGENTAKVVVTAENGNVTVYELLIICGEVETISIGGNNYTIDESFSEEALPEGFSMGEVTYKGRAYAGAVNANSTLALMSLKGAEKSEFFLYDQQTETFAELITLKVSPDKMLYVLPLNSAKQGYELTKITLGEKEADAWKLDEEFSLIKTVSMDGTECMYRYDHVDGTFQRHVEFEITEPEETVEEEAVPPEPEKEPTFLEQNYLYIIIGLGIFAIAMMILVICLLATRKTKRVRGKARERRKKREQSE